MLDNSVKEVKPLQLENASPAIDSIPSGMSYVPEYVVGIYANICELYKGEVNPLQPLKAPSPMLVTLLGILTEERPEQRMKA